MTNKVRAGWLMTAIWTVAVLVSGSIGVEAGGVGSQWMATGIVTRTASGLFYMLGKDDVIYKIYADTAKVLINDKPGSLGAIQVGDKVRVFGQKTGDRNIKALQLNVLGSIPKVEVIPSNGSTPPPSTVPPPTSKPGYVLPPPVQPRVIPSPVPAQPGRGPEPELSFRARGLVKDLHITEGWLTLLTGKGPVLVDLDQAQVTSRGKNTSSAELSIGDAVYVWGERIATGSVMASKVDILAGKIEAESTRPVAAVSATGIIRSLDYPSFTFVMDNAPGSVFVMSDEDTEIRSSAKRPVGFSDLKLGMKVKVHGLGSLTTGYLAQQIVIIGGNR